jgi:hypothetical protein
MNRFTTIVGLVPPQLFVFLLVGAGIALIVGAKRVATILVVTVTAVVFLPVILEPILASLPFWLLLVVGALAGFTILRAIMQMAIGKKSTDHAVGTLAADGLKGMVAVPFRIIKWVWNLLVRR